MKQFSRRGFLKSSSAFGALTVLPSHIALGKKNSSGQLPPSGQINVAFIASSGKGYGNRLAFLPGGLCNPVALCDVDLECKEARKSAGDHPNARQFTDFRVMFDKMADEIEFDREAKKITNNETANALIDPAPRKGWEEFYRL